MPSQSTTESPRMSLQNLPIELLQHICTYFHKDPDLQNLNLVSQRCRKAAASQLLAHLVIDASTPDTALASSITKLTAELNDETARHIRTLEILDKIDYRQHYEKWNDDGAPPYRSDGEELECKSSAIEMWYYEPRKNWKEGDGAEIWMALARLIERLPALSNVIWRIPARAPECILKALYSHSNFQAMGLHLRMFYFGSGLAETAAQYARDVAPMLSSVWVRFIPPQNQEEALTEAASMFLDVIVRQASKLKEIRASSRQGWLPEAKEFDDRMARQVLSAFTSKDSGSSEDNIQTMPLRRLSRLDIGGFPDIVGSYLQQWMRYVDVSTLTILNLDRPQDSVLRILSSNRPLKRLHTLILGLHYTWMHEPEFSDPLNEFLTSLPPLQTLRIAGKFDSSNLQNIMKVHGSTLRDLWISPNYRNTLVFDLYSTQQQLRQHCPNLRDLRLQIRRSKGDGDEVSIYKMLGSFPELQSLEITLDCSNPNLLTWEENGSEGSSPDTTFNDFEKEYYPPGVTISYNLFNRPQNGHIRDALMNSAVDGTLARQIWHVIIANKPAGAKPLESLKLHARAGGSFHHWCTLPGLPECFGQLQRSYLLTRKGRDGDVVVEPLFRTELHPWRNDMRLQRVIRTIFRSLWPGVDGKDGDWRSQWKSFPLSEVENTTN